jgi:hypothetical protein
MEQQIARCPGLVTATFRYVGMISEARGDLYWFCQLHSAEVIAQTPQREPSALPFRLKKYL